MRRLIIYLLSFVTIVCHAQNPNDNFYRSGVFPMSINENWQPESIHFLNDSTGFVIGQTEDPQPDSNIRIYKTEDSGANWNVTAFSDLILNSEIKSTESGMLYFTTKSVDSNGCVPASFHLKVFTSIDQGGTWQGKRVDDNLIMAFSKCGLTFLDNENALFFYQNANSSCGFDNDGVYMTNDKFNSFEKVGVYYPENVIAKLDEFMFWDNQELVKVDLNGIVSKEAKAIQCPEGDEVILIEMGDTLLYHYQIDCPADYGLSGSEWAAFRIENRLSLSSELQIIPGPLITNQDVAGSSMYTPSVLNSETGFREINFLEDSIYGLSLIEKDSVLDFIYVENNRRSHFVDSNLIFTLGYNQNDTNWVLFKNTTGQGRVGDAEPFINGTVAGLLEKNVSPEVTLWPNPANSSINISGLNEDEVYLIDCHGMDGRIVYTFKPVNNKMLSLDVNQLPKGMYILNIHDKQNELFVRLPFVKI